MKIVVLTSDKHTWLLHGFFHQWSKYANRYAPMEIEVAGFTKIHFLPKYASFYSIGKFEDYPVQKWSDGLIRYLHSIPDELVLVLLEDYWMMRPINWRAVSVAYSYAMDHKDIIRFDVAADRAFSRQNRYVETWGILDVCEAKGEYSLSFQASLFRKDLLLEVLEPGETPWETELHGSQRLNQLPYRVVGSYQWPLMYSIVMNKGQFDMEGNWMYPPRTLCLEDWTDLRKASCLPDQLQIPEVQNEHPL